VQVRVLAQPVRARLVHERGRGEIAGHHAVLVLVHVGGDDLVEEVRERLDQHVQRTGDQHGAMPGRAMALDGLQRLGPDRGADAAARLALHEGRAAPRCGSPCSGG
jgi:hypothetical protein